MTLESSPPLNSHFENPLLLPSLPESSYADWRVRFALDIPNIQKLILFAKCQEMGKE